MDEHDKIIDGLRFLAQSSRILDHNLPVDELMKIIMEESLRISGADLVCIKTDAMGFFPDQYYYMNSETGKPEKIGSDELPFSENDIPRSRPQKLNDDDRWRAYFKDLYNKTFESRLRIPLFMHEKWSGLIDYYSTSLDFFEDEDFIVLLKAVSDNLGISIINAEMADVLKRKNLENKLLIESSHMLARVLEQDEVLAAIADVHKMVVDYDAIGIYLKMENDDLEPLFWKGYPDPKSEKYLRAKTGEGLVGWVARTGQGIVVGDVTQDDRYISARDTTLTELVVPIKLKEKIVGVLNIESDRRYAYTDHDLALSGTFASKAAIAIERASLYRELVYKKQLDQEVDIARLIQKTFLPHKDIDIPGFDIAGINISSHQVGGDYYDYIHIEDNQTGLAIADVSGKGIPAALIMASVRASLIAEIRNNYAIRAIMTKVNRLLTESLDRGNFVTAVYGVLDSRSRIFTFSNAGHNPPILLRSTGEFQELMDGGLAFGIDETAKYDERPISLNSDDILVFYTDGVTETENRENEQFEVDRLKTVLKENNGKIAREIVNAIIDAVHVFKDPEYVLDDLTVMVLKVK